MSNLSGDSSSPRDLYFAKNVLKNFKEEHQLRSATKKNLEVIMETLNVEIQYQNSVKTIFLSIMSILFALVAIILPLISDDKSSIYFEKNGKNYELVNLTIPDKETGEILTYVESDNDKSSKPSPIVIIVGYFFIIGFYYLYASFKLRKLNDLYNLTRFVYSLK